MLIKIDAVDGINLDTQLQIVKDYIEQESENGLPKLTRKNWGTKIKSGNSRYHVKVHKTRTMLVFTIWWGV